MAILIIVVTSSSFLALKVGSRHPAVKRAVLSRIIPEFGGQLSIGELEIGLASLTARDVDVDLGPRASIHIPAATIGLSYRKLFSGGLDARHAVSSVILSGPTITLRYGVPDSARADSRGVLQFGEYLPDYLGISDATLVVEDASSGRGVTATSIDLLLERASEGGRVQGSATASLLGGQSNLSARIDWDTPGDVLTLDAELRGAGISDDLPLPEAFPLRDISAEIDADLAATLRADSPMALSLSFALGDGEFSLPGGLGRASAVSASGVYDLSDLSLTLGGATWDGARFTGRGEVDLAGRTVRSAVFSADGLQASRLAELAGVSYPPVSGVLAVEGHASGPWSSPRADARLTAREATVWQTELSDVDAELSYTDGRFDVGALAFDVFGGSAGLSGAATRSPASGGWAIDVRGDAVDLDAALATKAVGLSGWAGGVSVTGLEARFAPGALEIESLLSWGDVTAGPVAVGDGAGGFMLRDNVLSGTLSDARGRALLSGRVVSVYGEPSVEAELTLTDVRLDSLSASGGSWLPGLEMSGTMSASGPLEGFSVGGSVIAACEDCRGSVSVDGIVGIAGQSTAASLDLRSPDAVVRGVELPFSLHLTADAERVSFDPLDLGGLGVVRAEISAGSPRTLSGSVVMSEAELRDVVAVVSGVRTPESVSGLVFASASLGGTLGSPTASGQVQVGNGGALGIGGLSAVFAGAVDGGTVRIDEMSLDERGRRVVSVEGNVDLSGDLALVVTGDGVPGPFLGGDADTRFDVRLGVGGTRSRPTLDGLVEASAGTFLGVPFDEFLARITGAEGVMRVDPLTLEKRGSYRVSASGTVPVAALSDDPGGEEASLTVDVDGDPLAFLAQVVPFASEARSEGSMYVFLAGTRRDLTVASARLSVTGGTVRPSALFERIDDVAASVSIVDGRVTEGRIEGSVRGDPIQLVSVRPEEADVAGLPTLVVGGLDLGVLALSTGEDGVRASVPGLMLPEDSGRVAVAGKDGWPALLVGGPSGSPKLWGEITFSDVSFTYPLLDSGGEGDFFSSADWSLSMTAGRNLWYWRPDANLQVMRGGTLEFRGIPDDGTMCVSGRVEAQRGSVTYANTDFDVGEAFVDFPLFCEPPRFYVLAETRVEDGTTVTLTMDSYEGAFTSSVPGATFDESELRLTSDSPDGDSREEILAKLQYGVSYGLLETEEQASLERRRALEVVGSQLSGKIVRPLLSPVEGRIKRVLNLDLVRFDIDFVQHFIAQLDLWQAQEGSAGYQPFLTDTRITLGKYIARDWLLSYVSRAESYEEDLGDPRLGFRHELGVEYEVSRNTSISMRVVYDPSLAGWDRLISIENRFRF